MKPKTYLVYDIETIPTALPESPWNLQPGKDFPPIWAHVPICIGMILMQGPKVSVKTLSGDEKAMLTDFNTTAHQVDHIVDFNGKRFDMPVIQHRTLAHGMKLGWYLNKPAGKWEKSYRDKFGGRQLDLVDKWNNFGSFRGTQLVHIAKLCGLPGKIDGDGSKVKELYEQGRQAEIEEYCLQDTFQTALVLVRMLHQFEDITTAAAKQQITSLLRECEEICPSLHGIIDQQKLLDLE